MKISEGVISIFIILDKKLSLIHKLLNNSVARVVGGAKYGHNWPSNIKTLIVPSEIGICFLTSAMPKKS